jgi:hypothetical protein
VTPPRLLAAAARAQRLAITVICGGEILALRRAELSNGADARREILGHLRKAAVDFDASTLIVEPDGPCSDAAIESGMDVRRVSIPEVMSMFVPKDAPRTQSALFDGIIALAPRLARLVKLVPGTLRVSMTEPRKTVSLLSAALALAVARTG